MEAEVERPQLEPLQEVMGPAEEVHRDPSEADMNLHIFAARVGPVHVHGELAKKQEVHPPQHHDSQRLNYPQAAKEEMHGVATSPQAVVLVGKSGVEAWEKMKEALPSEHKPEVEHKPHTVVLTKELPPEHQEVHSPQHHDSHRLNYPQAAKEEMHVYMESPRVVALHGKSGVEAWDHVLETLPSEHKPHMQHQPHPVVLTKEVPAERQEVHPPQHHDPHKLNYAAVAKEEVHEVVESPRAVALRGKSGVEAWDHVNETLPSQAKHVEQPLVVERQAVHPALHPPQHHDPHALNYAQAAREEVHEAATSPRAVALRGKSGVEAWDKVNETLPSLAEGHIKHDMQHMLAGFAHKEQ